MPDTEPLPTWTGPQVRPAADLRARGTARRGRKGSPADRARRLLPSGLTGLAAAACAACCVLPVLLAVGLIGGAGWAAANRSLPGVAVALAVLAGLSWWWASRRRHADCCFGGSCSCGTPTGTQT